jgi:hypothetical protein
MIQDARSHEIRSQLCLKQLPLNLQEMYIQRN